MIKQEVLEAIDSITVDINNANQCVSLYNREIRDLNKKIKAFRKEHVAINCYSVEKYNEVASTTDNLLNELIQLKELKKSAEDDLIELRRELCKYGRMLFEQFNGEIYNHEFNKMLEEKTGLKWQDQWIFDKSNVAVGVALVCESDDNYNKKIVAEDISIANNEAIINNTDTMKVILTDIGGSAVLAYQNWDWMKLYLYATTGFYTNEKMRVHYLKFLERDRKMVEDLCGMIYCEVMEEANEVSMD